MASKAKAFDLEKAITELESLVASMEDGRLSLEEALQRYERGVALARACEQALGQAEQKIVALAASTAEADPTSLAVPATEADG